MSTSGIRAVSCGKDETAAPAPEIEITPEMIEAGASALFDHDSRFEGEEEAVARIFRAMIMARDCRSSES
jgi:hypothetical protein